MTALSTQALKFVAGNVNPGAIWQLVSQSAAQSKNIAKYAGSVLFGSWDKLGKDPRSDTIALLKLAGGAGLGIWSAATMFRNYEEGRAATTNSGNRDGSMVWSYSQALLHLSTLATTATGMLMPKGPTGMILRNMPALAVVPSLLALGMDHFQALATCNNNHIFAKMAQFGVDNYLLDLKTSENPGGAFRSSMLPWWHRNIRNLDTKVFGALGINFRKVEIFPNGPVRYA